jgi:hypothetical protein
MNDIAKMVSETIDNIKITHIDSPRTEFTGDHYYKYTINILRGLGYKPTRTIKEEIDYVSKLLLPRREQIDKLRDVVLPKIKWR